MKKGSASHLSHVFGSPWAGVYATRIESERHFGRHWHAVYGMGWLEHGAQRSASGRGTVDAYAGDIITTNPGEVHDGHPLGTQARHWCMVYIEPETMASMTDAATQAPSRQREFTQPVFQDARLRAAMLQLWKRLRTWHANHEASTSDALACEESLVQVCALMGLQYHGAAMPRGNRADVQPVYDRLADDPVHAPTLDAMAAMVGLSKFQLLRRFEKAYGLTPYAWVMQQRTELARQRMRQFDSLAELAVACGFADQSHMTRIFSRQFGFTPGALRTALSK
jgi:AraC-like DNA-binding protein